MVIAIILAAGNAKRCENKLLQSIDQTSVLDFSLAAFEKHELINQIIVMVHKNNKKQITDIIKQGKFKKVKAILHGGKSRQESVAIGMQWIAKEQYNALIRNKSLKAKSSFVSILSSLQEKKLRSESHHDIIIIHNGANPCVTEEEITNVIHACKKFGAAACGHKIVDTVKEINEDGMIVKTIPRNNLIAAQTPQAIRLDVFIEAIKYAKKNKIEASDDVSLVEYLGKTVQYVPASPWNKKITFPHDLEIMKNMLESRNAQKKQNQQQKLQKYIQNWSNNRAHQWLYLGIGQDSHAFDTTLGLTLGGVHFRQYRKLKGDSDGDIILHALFNAISSSIGELSIGQTATKMCKNGIKKSEAYLQPLLEKMRKKNLTIGNIAISIEAKEPKIDPLVPKIKQSLSKIFRIAQKNIGITATSGEGLTPFGQGKGMQCTIVVSLKSIDAVGDERFAAEM